MSSIDHPGRATSPPAPSNGKKESFWQNLFAGSAGGLLSLALLKFGNPVIFDPLIERPGGFWEFIFQPWPISWGYALLGAVTILGLKRVRFSARSPSWIELLPLVWLGWQVISATKTVDPNLTKTTLLHFGSCVLWFYLGLLALGPLKGRGPFWFGLLPGFIIVLWIGFEQHYGGLDATRRFLYEQPNWRDYPAEYLKRIASDRVFSTLVYPNALAGAIILHLPVALAALWNLSQGWPQILRRVFSGLVVYLGLACLIWSGSKAGWLIAVLLGAVAFRNLPLPGKLRTWIIGGVIVVGLVGFAAKFSSYFKKGATSAAARLVYWHAALITAKENPVFGTGPGTFSVAYAKIRPPNAEMARLSHNDYLEQASDSGIVGFLSYFGFIGTIMVLLYRKRPPKHRWFYFPAWLGLLGWSIQSFVEFPLYIPALAWPAFGFLGYLFGSMGQKRIKSTVETAIASP